MFICNKTSVLRCSLGVPQTILQPQERAFWSREEELALVHLQGEGHAKFLQPQRHWCFGPWDCGGHEDPSLWSPWCGWLHPQPWNPVEQERYYVQVWFPNNKNQHVCRVMNNGNSLCDIWSVFVCSFRCLSIGRYTSDLPHSTVDSLIESALSVWSRASTLTFVRSPTRNADIMVEFATYGGWKKINNTYALCLWTLNIESTKNL